MLGGRSPAAMFPGHHTPGATESGGDEGGSRPGMRLWDPRDPLGSPSGEPRGMGWGQPASLCVRLLQMYYTRGVILYIIITGYLVAGPACSTCSELHRDPPGTRAHPCPGPRGIQQPPPPSRESRGRKSSKNTRAARNNYPGNTWLSWLSSPAEEKSRCHHLQLTGPKQARATLPPTSGSPELLQEWRGPGGEELRLSPQMRGWGQRDPQEGWGPPEQAGRAKAWGDQPPCRGGKLGKLRQEAAGGYWTGNGMKARLGCRHGAADLSVCPSLCLSIHLPVSLPTHSPVDPSIHLSVCSSLCPSVHPTTHPSLCLSIPPSVPPDAHPPTCLSPSGPSGQTHPCPCSPHIPQGCLSAPSPWGCGWPLPRRDRGRLGVALPPLDPRTGVTKPAAPGERGWGGGGRLISPAPLALLVSPRVTVP